MRGREILLTHPPMRKAKLPLWEVKVYPTDILEHVCEYSTLERENVTYGGDGTYDEMCVTGFRYWPKANFDARSIVSIPWKTRDMDLDDNNHACNVPGAGSSQEIGVADASGAAR